MSLLEMIKYFRREPSIQPPSDHSSDSSVTEADQLDPHNHSPSLQATMESVTESSKAISESL